MNEVGALVIILFILIFAVLFYYLVKMIQAVRRRKRKSESRVSQMGFVVDTFHELVTRLKAKERELEILRKNAEEKACAIETYNENILQSVPSGVISFNSDFRVTKMNIAASRILGLDAAEVAGKSYLDIFGRPISEILEKQEIVERAEFGYTTGSGKRIWLGLNMSPLKDEQNTVIGRLLVFTDLTELKAFQSRKELRERLSTLGEMSAGIAHELRNPMAVISGYTKILSKKVDGSSLSAVEAIAKEVAVMDRIVTDFLTFAKPKELVLADVDLDEVIRTCLDSCSEKMKDVSIVNHARELPVIRADEILLRQAITNIFQNAIESMPGGGELTICAETDEAVTIFIKDTGHGIPENIKDKIFLPFFTTKEQGTGLGLSIVHKIIVSHAGTIHAESCGTGTTFSIRLPREIIVK